jgi:hypothetical protein
MRALAAAVAALVCGGTAAGATPAPDQAKRWSFEIAAEAHELVDGLDARTLLDDARFLEALEGVLRSELDPAAKVDAFVLLLHKVGWLFAGQFPVPEGRTYEQMANGVFMTFARYQDRLAGLESDVAPFLEISSRACGDHVIRCANALLLAALLDRRSTEPAVLRAISPERMKKAEVEAILLHGVALSAMLTRSTETILRLANLFATTSSEEGREDLVAAIAVLEAPGGISALRTFAETDVKTRMDNATSTAIDVVRRRIGAAAFQTWLARLSAIAPAEVDAELARGRMGGFAVAASSGLGTYRKIWDGFDVVIYDDGLQISHPSGFNYFLR